jgi:radical SAM superfamily enzyme YgiQ (UPF0313 family)
MRIVLVGADFEENLGVGMIAAVARQLGHTVRIVTYDRPDQRVAVARAVLSKRPHVVGLSMQFQHRAHDFLALARTLRASGFKGHLTCGGQFPSLAWREVLSEANGLDTVVFNDGEQTFTELLAALEARAPLDEIPGLGLRTADGVPRRTPGRPLNDALDTLPLPLRYRAPTRHLGVPFVPIMASRGCWGACTYCSITSTFRDARTHGGGRTFRERSPENVAEEMAALWHREGGPCIFCFHDDNLLKPRPEDTLSRLGAIRSALDADGVGRLGIIGKCRPDCVTPALARTLREMGVIRLYVGVENASEMGALHLNRARQTEHVDAALAACREAGIFVCYNLLIFEPDAKLEDIAENIAFIRGHADHPVNFCRAEPYAGTPLAQQLAARDALTGSYLGYDYRITDDRTELLFRIAAAAFRQRNFDASGVANRYMGLGYSQVVLEHFYPELGASRHEALRRQCRALTRAIATETADFLDEALALARRADPSDLDGPFGREFVERETALLGLRVAAADKARHAALDALYAEMSALAREAASARGVGARVVRTVKRLALGASLAAVAAACDDTASPSPDPEVDQGTGGMVVDPLPPDGGRPDYMVADPLPQDAGRPDFMVVDPPPPDFGRADFLVSDPPPADFGRADFLVADPLPVDAGMAPDLPIVVDPLPQDAGMAADLPFVVDPLPRDAAVDMQPDVPPVVDPPPPDHAMNEPSNGPGIDQWRDTTPRRAERTMDLPLWAPPDLRITAQSALGGLTVRVEGGLGPASLRWEGDGVIEGDGETVRWLPGPLADDPQIRVAVRTRGGVGVLAMRARDVRG